LHKQDCFFKVARFAVREAGPSTCQTSPAPAGWRAVAQRRGHRLPLRPSPSVAGAGQIGSRARRHGICPRVPELGPVEPTTTVRLLTTPLWFVDHRTSDRAGPGWRSAETLLRKRGAGHVHASSSSTGKPNIRSNACQCPATICRSFNGRRQQQLGSPAPSRPQRKTGHACEPPTGTEST